MEKRYQVFISSTFQDLQNARQEVSQALLRADCFPAGMELFPAADEEQFEFIKTIIDQSDYYILISAGRYGSIHPETGLSYTEMEYDYAVSIGKPIIRLLHKDPFNELKGKAIETSAKGKKALQKFRDKLCSESLVKFWESPEQLKAETVFALQDAQKRRPAIGWLPATQISSKDAELEIATLRAELAELKLSSDRIPPSLKNTNELVDTTSSIWSACELLFHDLEIKQTGGLIGVFDFFLKLAEEETFDWEKANTLFREKMFESDEDLDALQQTLNILQVHDVAEWNSEALCWQLTPFGEKVDSFVRVWEYVIPKTPPPSAP